MCGQYHLDHIDFHLSRGLGGGHRLVGVEPNLACELKLNVFDIPVNITFL